MSTHQADLTPQIRGILAAVFLQALKDAKKDGYLGEEARRWIIEEGSAISRALYGLDVDGLYLLSILDRQELEPVLRYKAPRFSGPVQNYDRTQPPNLPDRLTRFILVPVDEMP